MVNRIVVKHKNSLYSLEMALKYGYVVIKDCDIVSPCGDQIKWFTGFYDINEREIYTEDVLQDKDGKIFVVKERYGNLFLIDTSTNEIVRSLFSISIKQVVNMICKH